MKGVVLWTGGKDSALALHLAVMRGCTVVGLVTFVPEEADFLAHPLEIMNAQAQALGLPHYTQAVAPPYERSYEGALGRIREGFQVDTVIVGDIAEVNGYPNWIRQRSRPVGLQVWTPLWGKDRLQILNRLFDLGIVAIFSGVRSPFLSEEWVGRELNRHWLGPLQAVAAGKKMDLCGEQGEYHTLVLDAPLFQRRIEIKDFSKKLKDDLAYLQIHKWAWIPK